MTTEARTRLILYLIIGCCPELISWLTLTFDWTPRGVAILVAKLILAGAINWRAFIDGTGKDGKPQKPPADPPPEEPQPEPPKQ